MGKVTVYRFKVWDQQAGVSNISTRWATREAAEKLPGGVVFEETRTEVDESAVGREHLGMTDQGYDPNPGTGFEPR